MRVRARPADDTACGQYRVYMPVAALQAAGEDVGLFNRYLTNRDEELPDVVVVQRPLLRHTVEEVIPKAQAAGIAVVVEIDDDFTALHHRNMAFARMHPQSTGPDFNWQWIGRACAAADLVTCTTPALAARYAGHGRVAVIPNYVPAAYLDVPHAGDGHTVGWAGNLAVHPEDLDQVGFGVADAIMEHPKARFMALGDELTLPRLRIPPKRGEYVPWVNFGDYAATIARFDIGLVPLQNNQFNQAKSCLKMLEYAATGVVPVVSPTADNVRLNRETGIGRVCRRPKDWRAAVRRYLEDPQELADAAVFNKTVVADRLTIEGNAWRWMEAWESAVQHRHRTGRRTA